MPKGPRRPKRFLLDEGFPYRLAAFLIAHGHDVTTVGHDYPLTLADVEILERVRRERRTILTNDNDFGDLVVRDKRSHDGVVLFRLDYVPLEERIALLQRVLADFADALNQFIGVTRAATRVHRA